MTEILQRMVLKCSEREIGQKKKKKKKRNGKRKIEEPGPVLRDSHSPPKCRKARLSQAIPG